MSYWNWYRFPSAYAVAEAIDQVGGWICGGLVLAAVFRRFLDLDFRFQVSNSKYEVTLPIQNLKRTLKIS